ncbi:hypothetical protein TIFTF001_038667 [Ficus carica]|uniref:Uncharacterized protein n=1 Tax=Ficus carica TaxID=3494 RepID=A0AA88JE18_FICCA|nr:hypothetical protein TIFTF001_038662 [Ficus carica]GMN69622.1 hypothetical protein TIFTF001_038667 [Ficus carica]
MRDDLEHVLAACSKTKKIRGSVFLQIAEAECMAAGEGIQLANIVSDVNSLIRQAIVTVFVTPLSPEE